MKDLRLLDVHRDTSQDVIDLYGSCGGSGDGVFRLRYAQTGATLLVVASTGGGWDHVSVSLAHRCPNWFELEFVKRLFFKDDETAMQLHLPSSDHISFHPYTLHLWRPQNTTILRPPSCMVALVDGGEKIP